MVRFNRMSPVVEPSGAPSTAKRAGHRDWLWAAALAAFLALSIGFSLTRAPWWDEGVFADVALNFRNRGHLGSSVLDPHGYLEWPQVNYYTYWQFPLYLIVAGTWLHAVPPTVEWIRLLSVLCGCLYIYCWFALVRCLTRNQPLALFVASVVALDYATVATASDGRMDMMCAALGEAAMAIFVCLKGSNWTRAMFWAGCLGAASLFCHPMGALMNASLAALALLEWRQIRWQGLLAASIPYLIGAALWLAYISEAPQIFLAQTKAASGYRVGGLSSVIRNVANDLYLRYGGFYFGNLSGIYKFKVASLVFAVVGTVALASNRRLRGQPLGRFLLISACIGYVGVAAIDNQKFPIYFIYSMPVMSACGALWVYNRWRNGGAARLLPAALLASSLLATIGGFAFKIYGNDYDHLYRPTIRAIRTGLPPGGLIMGGSELGFAFGFGPGLIDDRYLGYRTGKRPDVFVENEYYGRIGPAGRAADRVLGSQYHLTFANSAYKVYVRNDVAHPESSGK